MGGAKGRIEGVKTSRDPKASWSWGVGLQRDPMMHKGLGGGEGKRWAVGGADNEIVTHLDKLRSTSSHPTTFLNSLIDRSPPSPLGKVDAPLERGVSGRAGSPRSKGEGQRRTL